MTTVRDIVQRAYRKTGIAGLGEAIESDMADEGLDALNMMLAAWKLAGVDTSHTTATLSSAFPLAAEYEEGTVYMLASRLSPDYQVPQDFDADDFFRKIQAAYMTIDAANLPDTLRYWGRKDIIPSDA